LQTDPTSKKKKKDGGAIEEEISLTIYPDSFTAHIGMTHEWLRMKNSVDKVSIEEKANRACNHFEHPKFGNILYQIFPKRPYGLILADIYFGFNQTTCMYNDKESWREEELLHMMQAIKMTTTSKN
jgi:hypothetical protein